ncbi:MAG TPA: carboxypeptidase-like regulatory domain-containing protein [Terriglobales bacterium]|nr:carboxypeptidase-like regulatory domain-containing protein [Terriglobales bacterium]
MRTVLACTMALALVVPICAQKKPAPPPVKARYRIAGTVVNEIGGQVLAQATVSIEPVENPDEARQTTTDEDGHFSFDNVSPGKYSMSAQRRGFAQQSYQQHEFYSTAVVVGAGLVSENLVFQLRPDASISGTVTDDQSEPVRSGRAMLFQNSLQNGAQGVRLLNQVPLDDGGRYRFDHLEPGKYYVAVLARPWFAQYLVTSRDLNGQAVQQPASNSDLDVSYPLTYYPAATDSGGAAVIALAPGDRTTADIVLTAVPSVHARVVNFGDSGNVSLFQTTFDGTKVPVFADSNEINPGVIELSGIAPGRFVLTVQGFGRSSYGREDRTVDLAGGEQIDAAERYPSTASITGTVHLENGKPPSQVFLRFRNLATGESFGAPVSEKGEFQLAHDIEKGGSYELGLFHEGSLAVKTVSATGAKVQGHTVTFTGGGAVKLNVTVTEALAKITGIVLRDGKPLSQSMVLLVPEDPANNQILIRRDQSDSDGTFTLASVVPGRYTALAIQKGWDLEWSNAAVLQPYMKAGVALQIDTPRTFQIKLTAQ